MDSYQVGMAFGAASALLSLIMPIALWWLVLRRWKPNSRPKAAFRFALWPVVISTYFLAGPLLRAMLGVSSPLPDLSDWLMGLPLYWLFFGGICFAIGWARWKPASVIPDEV